ncbi:hypothetical protein AMS66_21460 [Paenibacillus xylanivorans]|uniref:Uncharacterized protein n=1 Tax=Paenibacillus xylanivorans TaxID=1705561 RepID=A0A0M9BL73_9BACL|nr:hypothetical protein AMS66_21460 [Paenibacillus xylanivorans]
MPKLTNWRHDNAQKSSKKRPKGAQNEEIKASEVRYTAGMVEMIQIKRARFFKRSSTDDRHYNTRFLVKRNATHHSEKGPMYILGYRLRYVQGDYGCINR